ncbi:NAD(P)H-dependent oxidoreductase 1 [Asimina triloba]
MKKGPGVDPFVHLREMLEEGKEMASQQHKQSNMAVEIPKVSFSSGAVAMPVVGMGTASYPPVPYETLRSAMLHAIQVGYRHFDTASLYSSERPLGQIIQEALRLGLIKSRDELFITSKLWCTDNHGEAVLAALTKSLILKPGSNRYPFEKEDLAPMDYKSTWAAMEECQALGLTKAIGVSNFSSAKLANLLSVAKIPPAVNQDGTGERYELLTVVEMHPVWQQRKLKELCKANGIHLVAYSPLGSKGTPWGSNQVMDCPVLKEIAEATGKTVAQVALRWIYEQGASMVVKSFDNERMVENLQIFDWALTENDAHMIDLIPQKRGLPGDNFLSPGGPFKSLDELWDGEL